jgi:hypothetical protein
MQRPAGDDLNLTQEAAAHGQNPPPAQATDNP